MQIDDWGSTQDKNIELKLNQTKPTNQWKKSIGQNAWKVCCISLEWKSWKKNIVKFQWSTRHFSLWNVYTLSIDLDHGLSDVFMCDEYFNHTNCLVFKHSLGLGEKVNLKSHSLWPSMFTWFLFVCCFLPRKPNYNLQKD